MAATQVTNPANVSPKVKASAWTILALTVLSAALAGITPDMLEFLGPWAGTAFLAIGAIGVAIAGYLKTDPARNELTRAVDYVDPQLQTPTGQPPLGYALPAAEVQQVYVDEDGKPDDGVPGRHEAV